MTPFFLTQALAMGGAFIANRRRRDGRLLESGRPGGSRGNRVLPEQAAPLVNAGPAFAKLTAIPLRGGFFLDRQHFLDFKGNTVLNRGVSGGLGLVWTRLTLDFAYVYVFAPREPAARVEEIALGPGETGVSFEGFRQEPGEGKFSRHQVLVTAIVRF